jgi:hypothetical protein
LVDAIHRAAFQGSALRSIQVADGNRHFRISGDLLLSFDGQRLVHYFGFLSAVVIPAEVAAIPEGIFGYGNGLRAIRFARHSRLRRIEAGAFVSLHSIRIPMWADAIDGRAFQGSQTWNIQVATGSPHFRTSGSLLLTADRSSLIRYFGRKSEAKILPTVTKLCSWSFSRSAIRKLSFLGTSGLRTIESFAFYRCPFLHAICIPASVDSIDGSAFAGCHLREIVIEDGNRHFGVFGRFLMNGEGTSLVRYFGEDESVTISREIEIVCVGSFSFCDQIRKIDFESPSKVRVIESRAFEHCLKLESISLPASTERLCESSFQNCDTLRVVRIEGGSKLHRIEMNAFEGCSKLQLLFVPECVNGNADVDLSGTGEIEIVSFE